MTNDPGVGDGRTDLAMRSEELSGIGETAGGLGADLVNKGLQASGSSYAAVPVLLDAGLDSGNGLRHTTARFFRKTMDLKEDCARIEEHLTGTVTSHSALEDDLLTGLRTVQAPAAEPAGNPALDALLAE
ncbi:hypothetical protein [Streptomyces johnsoniae]|uniref:Uncharacterized protein n=1 Tax=Streptomyces johnsoniae TaxID=3075532 RepID=A0ABU2RZT6_9ACTN|nr:hypothetical protein [Streptomyces sp. DSM 41886]MDT0441029.1 hypothetical protein [Streptomyces sp. DSM 41886]